MPPDGQPPAEENQGWSIFSYLIAGMVAYGLIGWLAAWLTHIPVLLPVGALAGLVFAVGGVVWKYGRNSLTNPHANHAGQTSIGMPRRSARMRAAWTRAAPASAARDPEAGGNRLAR